MRVKSSGMALGLANSRQWKICKCPTPGTDKAGKWEGGSGLGAGGID